MPESLKGDRSEVSSVNSFISYVYRLHGTVSDCNCREKCHNLQTYDTSELVVSSCIGEVCFGEKGGTEDWLHVSVHLDSGSKRFLELLSVNSQIVSYSISPFGTVSA